MPYTLSPKPGKSVRVYGRGLRISPKSSVIVCRAINRLNFKKGKGLLTRVAGGKESLEGKYYTNTTKAILDLLKSAESNADFKGLTKEKLIIHASAHKGFGYMRPRKFKARRQQRKITNVQIVLQER